MTTVSEALDALEEAYAAKDAAMARAVAEVDRQFAAILLKRQQEYTRARQAREAKHDQMDD